VSAATASRVPVLLMRVAVAFALEKPILESKTLVVKSSAKRGDKVMLLSPYGIEI
jgi:hypothetical protein